MKRDKGRSTACEKCGGAGAWKFFEGQRVPCAVCGGSGEKEGWLRVNTDSTPLTLEAITAAMKAMEAGDYADRKERIAKVEKFWATVPEHLRSHPLAAGMASLIETGTPVHPKDKERLEAEWKRLKYAPLDERETGIS